VETFITLHLQNVRPKFYALLYVIYSQLQKMFYLLLKKIFVFTTTIKLFGAKMIANETQPALKFLPYITLGHCVLV
jgi:hypothetical protein